MQEDPSAQEHRGIQCMQPAQDQAMEEGMWNVLPWLPFYKSGSITSDDLKTEHDGYVLCLGNRHGRVAVDEIDLAEGQRLTTWSGVIAVAAVRMIGGGWWGVTR